MFFKMSLTDLQPMETGSARREKRSVVIRRYEQIPCGQPNGSLGIQHVSATGSATVPVRDFHQIYAESLKDCLNTDMIIMGCPMQRATGKIVYIHVKTLLGRGVFGGPFFV